MRLAHLSYPNWSFLMTVWNWDLGLIIILLLPLKQQEDSSRAIVSPISLASPMRHLINSLRNLMGKEHSSFLRVAAVILNINLPSLTFSWFTMTSFSSHGSVKIGPTEQHHYLFLSSIRDSGEYSQKHLPWRMPTTPRSTKSLSFNSSLERVPRFSGKGRI